jgi:hypothetical protein
MSRSRFHASHCPQKQFHTAKPGSLTKIFSGRRLRPIAPLMRNSLTNVVQELLATKVDDEKSPVFMLVSRTSENCRNESELFTRQDNVGTSAKSPLCVTELRNRTCVFLLTIYFVDSIQRTNCDDVMSQCSMTSGKGE